MKIGIVGVGFMGSTHAASWAKTDAEIAGFVGISPAEAAGLAQQYHAKVFPDLDALLQEVDAVDICTPTPLHHPMVLQAARAGRHVICEKPLARTVEQAQEMIAACRSAGVHLLVAHVVRYFSQYALAHQAVAEGQIGRPGILRLSRCGSRPQKTAGNWFLDEAQSGGVLMDMLVHDYDFARWVAGEVESVFAKKVTTGHPDAPIDYGMVILKHRGGALSHLAAAWAYPPPTFRTHIEIAGDAGLVEFDSDASAPILSLVENPGGSDMPAAGQPSSPLAESPYTTEIREFYRILTEGGRPRVSVQDGLAAVQIAQAALESARTGSAVILETLPEVRS